VVLTARSVEFCGNSAGGVVVVAGAGVAVAWRSLSRNPGSAWLKSDDGVAGADASTVADGRTSSVRVSYRSDEPQAVSATASVKTKLRIMNLSVMRATGMSPPVMGSM